MNDSLKTYRIKTEVGKDTQLHVKLEQNYEVLEVMSLKINQKNVYRYHSSNYGVVAGRVLANGALGIPNAKVSVFINIDDTDINDVVKTVLYPYNTTKSKDGNGVRYNLLPKEKINKCHTPIGTFPSKEYVLDNDCILEVFEKYYKFTTKTNNAGDYMIFGVPTGNQTIHVDLDLSDIGILSQKPRDMVYKGYNITQFENPNKFKGDTNLESLTQIISQDNITEVIPFWGDETENSIGITRCDININYKFEPTCVFLGSVVSDTSSNGISKKCIPSPNMGAMDDLVTGSGTIEMIRKTPDGGVEEFQIQGTQLINGDGVWCYQIPMNLDYVMTDEYGNTVPTNDPNKGIPTRTKVRFRVSMQDFENDNTNIFRCKMLVPNNPEIDEPDYQFGSATKEESFKDLFWNGVYSVKSYIPRIQKGDNWKNQKFTGFKAVNYYGDKNPIPYNNIRIRIPFMFTIICALIKIFVLITQFLNKTLTIFFRLLANKKSDATFVVLDGTLCNDDLENVCIIPGINVQNIVNGINDGEWFDADDEKVGGGLARTIEYFTLNYLGKERNDALRKFKSIDEQSIDIKNKVVPSGVSLTYADNNKDVTIRGIRVTDSVDYLIKCVEMNLAQEYRVIQFDFYNDWINGVIYIPRWMRNITKKRTFLWGAFSFGGKVKACNTDYSAKKINLVQQCSLTYQITNNTHDIKNNLGCDNKNSLCHKSKEVRKKVDIFKTEGIVHDVKTLKGQYVYYFKPCDTAYYGNTSNYVKLFATDIILLGTLNEYDKWGIPMSLNELQSTTYQMPSNIVLTDGETDGESYENSAAIITYKYKKQQDGTKDNIKIEKMSLSPEALTLRGQDGNYTEMSGIDWGVTGPLQMENNRGETLIYKPGGHFLGLSCRNSETTIKTCINLSRICEHGVWMSQRQELFIPDKNNEGKFHSYATVPTGFIGKDEISDTAYRWQFATMNHNKLRTVIDKTTGYPIYEFKSVTPICFGGEMTSVISNDNNYNREITKVVTEKYYNYSDNEYYKRSIESTYSINETQIARTGEWVDNEYWRFRLGLTSETATGITAEKKRKYLISDYNGYHTFPLYENSFYFYFGLKNGATALDEFKKMYYAVCEEEYNLIQEDNDVYLTNLKVTYDGICENNGTGAISFNIKANEEMFNNGIKVLYNNEYYSVENSGDTLTFSGLSYGVHEIVIINGKNIIRKEIFIDRATLTGDVIVYDFNKDIGVLSPKDIFEEPRIGDVAVGGYIEIKDNIVKYNKGMDGNNDTENQYRVYNIFSKSSTGIDHLEVTSEYIGKPLVIKNSRSNPLEFKLYLDGMENGSVIVSKSMITGNYCIPLPAPNLTYKVALVTYMDDTGCHFSNKPPMNDGDNETHEWELGETFVNNLFVSEL